MTGPQQDEHRASPWQALSGLAPELAAERFPCTVLPRQPPPPVCTQPNLLPDWQDACLRLHQQYESQC